MPELADIPITIRPYEPPDAAPCRFLYEDGLIGNARIASNDTAIDLDDIVATYIRVPGNGFWVAVNDAGEVLGMIGVQHHDAGVGEVRRLRVRRDSQRRGIGSKLLERAIAFCLDNGYLKVTLDTYIGGLSAERYFEKYQYRLEKTKSRDGRDVRYFFRDLYARPGDDRTA